MRWRSPGAYEYVDAYIQLLQHTPGSWLGKSKARLESEADKGFGIQSQSNAPRLWPMQVPSHEHHRHPQSFAIGQAHIQIYSHVLFIV